VSGGVLLFFDVLGALYVVFKLKMAFSKPKDFSRLFKQVFAFTLYIFFMVIVSTITSSMGKTILGQMVGMGAVTIFGYGLQFYLYENQISMAISSQFSPRINALAIDNKQEDISALFSRVSLLQLIILFLIVGGFASCGLDFIQAWLGGSELQPQDFQTIFYLSLGFLLLGIIPLSQNLGIEIQRAENKHRYLSTANLVCSLASIGIAVLCVYLLPIDYKVYGPLIGIGSSLIVGMVIISSVYYKKVLSLPIKHYYLDFIKTGLIAVIAWAIVFVVFRYAIKVPETWNLWWGTIIKGCSFLVIYGIAIAAVDRKFISEIARKKTAR
jgi:O-antigen/teichoic acid export membrane protein